MTTPWSSSCQKKTLVYLSSHLFWRFWKYSWGDSSLACCPGIPGIICIGCPCPWLGPWLWPWPCWQFGPCWCWCIDCYKDDINGTPQIKELASLQIELYICLAFRRIGLLLWVLSQFNVSRTVDGFSFLDLGEDASQFEWVFVLFETIGTFQIEPQQLN